MQEPTNETRANRARTALLPYHANLTQDDQLDEALVDCLTDLMHLAKQRGTSFSKALGTAKDHFREEQPRQPIDLDDYEENTDRRVVNRLRFTSNDEQWLYFEPDGLPISDPLIQFGTQEACDMVRDALNQALDIIEQDI